MAYTDELKMGYAWICWYHGIYNQAIWDLGSVNMGLDTAQICQFHGHGFDDPWGFWPFRWWDLHSEWIFIDKSLRKFTVHDHWSSWWFSNIFRHENHEESWSLHFNHINFHSPKLSTEKETHVRFFIRFLWAQQITRIRQSKFDFAFISCYIH